MMMDFELEELIIYTINRFGHYIPCRKLSLQDVLIDSNACGFALRDWPRESLDESGIEDLLCGLMKNPEAILSYFIQNKREDMLNSSQVDLLKEKAAKDKYVSVNYFVLFYDELDQSEVELFMGEIIQYPLSSFLCYKELSEKLTHNQKKELISSIAQDSKYSYEILLDFEGVLKDEEKEILIEGIAKESQYSAKCLINAKELKDNGKTILVNQVASNRFHSYNCLLGSSNLNEDNIDVLVESVANGYFGLDDYNLEKLSPYIFEKLVNKVVKINSVFKREMWPEKSLDLFDLFENKRIQTPNGAYKMIRSLSGRVYDYSKELLFGRIIGNKKLSQKLLDKLPEEKKQEFETYFNSNASKVGGLIVTDIEGGQLALANELDGALSKAQDASESNETYVPRGAYGVTGGVFQ
jgi:hypothetical protein